jgi:hypothetical protein
LIALFIWGRSDEAVEEVVILLVAEGALSVVVGELGPKPVGKGKRG